LNPGFKYQYSDGINDKGISNSVLKTEGTTELKLPTTTHETTLTFHIMGSDFQFQCDGIIGRGFWEEKRDTISYCNREIIMGDIVIKFDPKNDDENKKSRKITLKAPKGKSRRVTYFIKRRRFNTNNGIVTWSVFGGVIKQGN
jgi:hypothetical protein